MFEFRQSSIKTIKETYKRLMRKELVFCLDNQNGNDPRVISKEKDLTDSVQ